MSTRRSRFQKSNTFKLRLPNKNVATNHDGEALRKNFAKKQFSKSLVVKYVPLTKNEKESILDSMHETSENRFKEYGDIFEKIKSEIHSINELNPLPNRGAEKKGSVKGLKRIFILNDPEEDKKINEFPKELEESSPRTYRSAVLAERDPFSEYSNILMNGSKKVKFLKGLGLKERKEAKENMRNGHLEHSRYKTAETLPGFGEGSVNEGKGKLEESFEDEELIENYEDEEEENHVLEDGQKTERNNCKCDSCKCIII